MLVRLEPLGGLALRPSERKMVDRELDRMRGDAGYLPAEPRRNRIRAMAKRYGVVQE